MTTIKRKSRAVDSQRVRIAAASRRLTPPPTLLNMPTGRLITVQHSQYGKLDIDPRYQRGETPMINELIAVLNQGGVIADPVSLAERKWGPEEERKKLWIVDGYQRACAYQAMNLPFSAMVYETRSLDQERLLFGTLNTRYAVSANLSVKAWAGPGAQLIRDAGGKDDHPLYGRVEYTRTSQTRLNASVLVSACVVAATGKTKTREVRKSLAELDLLMTRPAQRKLATDFLHLCGEIFGDITISPKMLALTSLALALHEHGGRYPSDTVVKGLKKIKWDSIVETGAVKYRPIVMEAIRSVWS